MTAELNVFIDKSLTCRECKSTFLFTASEQEFFACNGLIDEPRRCCDCRIKQKATAANKTISEALCAECGAKTHVPFRPSGFRPVYCCVCLHNHSARTTGAS